MNTSNTFRQQSSHKTATRFARQGTSYSLTRVACKAAAKVQRGLRNPKLAVLANNF